MVFQQPHQSGEVLVVWKKGRIAPILKRVEISTPETTDLSASPLFQGDHGREHLSSYAKVQGGQGGNLRCLACLYQGQVLPH